jgi:hypothetical protein
MNMSLWDSAKRVKFVDIAEPSIADLEKPCRV